MNCSGDGFVTNLTDCNGSGYFSYDDAVSWFSNITIDGKRYHLPNKEEWRTIVPHGFYFMNAFSTWNDWSIDVRETVTLRGVSMTFTSDFCVGVDSVSYALRYKGTDWVSAWRYEYISDGNNTHMKITARSLQGQLYGISAYVIVRPDFGVLTPRMMSSATSRPVACKSRVHALTWAQKAISGRHHSTIPITPNSCASYPTGC